MGEEKPEADSNRHLRICSPLHYPYVIWSIIRNHTMNYKNHPRLKSTILIMNNGASYTTQWILTNPCRGLEVDPNNNVLWKPYQDSNDLNTAKRISQFNERFGSLDLGDSNET